jgi:hypothetical protein
MYLKKYLKYKGKYIELKYGGSYTYKSINISNDYDEFTINAIRLFNTEIGKYLKTYLDNLATLIVSNQEKYTEVSNKNEIILKQIEKLYNLFISFIKKNKDEFEMKEFIKVVNENFNQ